MKIVIQRLAITICILMPLATSVAAHTAQGVRLIITYTTEPRTLHERKKWDKEMHALIHDYNKRIRISRGKRACLVVDRFDHHFGTCTLRVPPCASVDRVKEYIMRESRARSLPLEINNDEAIHVEEKHPDAGLEGVSLSLATLEKLKQGELLHETHGISHEEMNKALFWYQEVPTTGMRIHELPAYPYLPHHFSLWELAPHKGAGVHLAVIDTGVAAFPVEGHPQYKKNFDLEMNGDYRKHSFTVMADNDPLVQCIECILPYVHLAAENSLEILVPPLITDYLKEGSDESIQSFLKKYGSSSLFTAERRAFHDQGRTAVQAIAACIQKNFSLVKIGAPYNTVVVKEFLPLVDITNDKKTFVAGHGSHTFGVIAGKQHPGNSHLSPEDDIGICGIAPQAQVYMIKAFDHEGRSNKSTLIAALKRAISLQADVVNLSLKIADELNLHDKSTQLLDHMLGAIPYVVAASGNETNLQKNILNPKQAYPARFNNVDFDVGAFRYKDAAFPIVAFSQYEPQYGPRIVAPGYNILSSGLIPGQEEDSMYVFMSGTSMAAPITSGFLALVLGEFKNDFSEHQIKTVVYKAAMRLHDTDEWKIKTVLGAIDMRTALFMLHVLRYVQQQLRDAHVVYDTERYFNNMVEAVHYMLFAFVTPFSRQYLGAVSLQDDAAAFYTKASTAATQDPYLKKVSMAPFHTIFAHKEGRLDKAISYIGDYILAALDVELVDSSMPLYVAYVRKIHALLYEPHIDVFASVPVEAKRRLVKVKSVEKNQHIRQLVKQYTKPVPEIAVS